MYGGATSQFMIAVFLPPGIKVMEACVTMKPQSALVPHNYDEQNPYIGPQEKCMRPTFLELRSRDLGVVRYCDETCYILTGVHVKLN